MHNLDKLMLAATQPDWRDVKFWHTHDDRLLSVNELSGPHMINICRQIVNLACRETGLEAIPVKQPLADVNFSKYSTYTWVVLCRLFLREVDLRIAQGYAPTIGYMHILGQIREKIGLLAGQAAPEGEYNTPGGQLIG